MSPVSQGHKSEGQAGSKISLNYDFRSQIEVLGQYPQILIKYDRD